MVNRKTELYISKAWLKEVYNFKYLGATIPKDGSSTADVCIRIVTAAITRLYRIWYSNAVRVTIMHNCMSFILPVLLYGCEEWTLPTTF